MNIPLWKRNILQGPPPYILLPKQGNVDHMWKRRIVVADGVSIKNAGRNLKSPS